MPSTTGLASTWLAALGLLSTASVACSAPTADDVVDANGGQTQGIVLVDRIAAAADGPAQTHVSAKFMRTLGTSDAELAERMVGARLELPSIGECRSTSAPASNAPTLGVGASIELLDVGDVTMHAGKSVIPLATRAFPDIGGALVSGVFYTTRDATSELPTPAHYEIESSGSALLDRFSLQVEAPASPQDLRVGDDALADGVVIGDRVSPVIRWKAGQDLVYVDVTSPTTIAGVRCTFADTGEGTVPVRELGVFGAPASVSVAVHRVRRASFTAAGVDVGEARFDLAVVAHATLGAR